MLTVRIHTPVADECERMQAFNAITVLTVKGNVIPIVTSPPIWFILPTLKVPPRFRMSLSHDQASPLLSVIKPLNPFSGQFLQGKGKTVINPI